MPVRLLLAEPGDERVRATHLRVGAPWGWSSSGWSEERWAAVLGHEELRFYLVMAGGGDEEVAGLAWIRVGAGGDCEIHAFGLVPEWVGRGVGGHALTLALQQAWAETGVDGIPTRRVWLHTSSGDHPNAIRNYTARGLVPYFSVEFVRPEPS